MIKNKIGILGIGAIGSVISIQLSKNKSNNLFYYSRTSKEKIKLISEGHNIEIAINVNIKPSINHNLEWLIICIKEHQYKNASDWFQKLVSPTTKVVIIRNGLRLKEPLLEFTDEQNIIECIIDCPTQTLKNGYYDQLKSPILTIHKNYLTNSFTNLFDTNHCEIKLVSDFKTESWKKLCESSALGAILCLSGETCWIFKDKKLRTLYTNILQEATEVAKADGAIIEENFIKIMLNKLIHYPKTKGSSMLTDRLNGTPIELGAKNSVISTIGKIYNEVV